MVKEININDYDYILPQDKIPLHPMEKRDECKLLLRSPEGRIYHRKFKELAGLMPVSALLICNDTKVIKARLPFRKDTGAAIELFLLEPIEPSDYALNFQSRNQCRWKCLVGNSKKWKDGKISMNLELPVTGSALSGLTVFATRTNIREDGESDILFEWDNPAFTFGEIIEEAGKIPIPPYLNRESEESDNTDYQTVYADIKGSVAAPTAGLHFTPEVFKDLEAHGVRVGKVTLHVGAGTFRPVKSDLVGAHRMHSEPFTVSRQLLESILAYKKAGNPIVAVGTTSVRTLESLPYIGYALLNGKAEPFHVNQWMPYDIADFDTVEALQRILIEMDNNHSESISADTSIMIAPGFKWRLTDGMITNFHQPKSTLLLLVSSFLGDENWKDLYQEALKNNYRFLSYGDASFLLR